MRSIKTLVRLPDYQHVKYLQARLPDKIRDWSHGNEKSIVTGHGGMRKFTEHVERLNKKKAWRWPSKIHYFFSDLHADPEAFVESLIASGGVRKTGRFITDFELTPNGEKAVFIIGGDCFDKGPSSLNLLRTIRQLIELKARVHILAGNHDVRVLLGIEATGQQQDLFNQHFFIRTGQKIIPLLKEIVDQYVDEKDLRKVPDKVTARKLLFPDDDWFREFPLLAEPYMNPLQISREVERVQVKLKRFEKALSKNDLSLRQACAAANKWKELFLKPDGEFYWFYKRMRLTLQSGSLLFVHAGLDNVMARALYKKGTSYLNSEFKKGLKNKPFDFYYGPLCNMLRTKYRKVDHSLTSHGTRFIEKAGISAVIHGHRNLYHGQRMALRKGLLSFECDITLDCHSRSKEGLKGVAAGVTVIHPKGYILGISNDYPYAKFFHPDLTLKQIYKQTGRKIK